MSSAQCVMSRTSEWDMAFSYKETTHKGHHILEPVFDLQSEEEVEGTEYRVYRRDQYGCTRIQHTQQM